MGGNPLLALNIVAFPDNHLADLELVLKGGAEKIAEAGALLVGGHTIKDKEPKYGLAVVGLIHPEQVIYNNTPQAGDLLLLTKPLGTGILSTALKADLAEAASLQEATFWMTKLNRLSPELLKLPIHSMTDVTGFGLLGHLIEVCEARSVQARIEFAKVPILPNVKHYLTQGCVPGGTGRNWESYGHKVSAIDDDVRQLLCDPQTSGGLLVMVKKSALADFQAICQRHGLSLQSIGQTLSTRPGAKLVEVLV